MNMLCSRSIRSLPASPFTALYSPVDVRCLSKSQFLTQGQHAAGSSFQSDGPRVLLAWFSPAKIGRQRGEMRANPQINDCFVPKERPHMTHISSHEDCKESGRVRSTGLEFCKVCGVYAIWRGKKKKKITNGISIFHLLDREMRNKPFLGVSDFSSYVSPADFQKWSEQYHKLNSKNPKPFDSPLPDSAAHFIAVFSNYASTIVSCFPFFFFSRDFRKNT